MIISPDIFGKVKRKPFLSDTAFGGQLSFEVAPEAFESVYVGSSAVAVFPFTVINEPVDVSLCSDSGVTFPCVGEDSGTSLYPCVYKGDKRFGLNVRDHLGPHLAAPAKDAEHRSLCCPSAAFRASDLMGLPFVLPLATEIGLINLYSAAENFRDVLGHSLSYQKQGPQNTLSVEPSFKGYSVAGEAFEKRHRYASPLRCRKSEGKTVRLPFISTTSATTLFPSNDVGFRKSTTRTFVPFCHATYVS